jgi:hypothetical protein
MQTKLLLPATGSAISGNITGSIVQYNPISSTVGLFLLSIVSTVNNAIAITSATVDLQGTVDDVVWVSLLNVPVGSLKAPVNQTDIGSIGGYRSYAQVVQTMPRMRVVTSGALATGAGASTTFLRAVLLNG